ncbi:tubulin binding cofactor C-domain-containing protein [Dipodascopsis uninucleata]
MSKLHKTQQIFFVQFSAEKEEIEKLLHKGEFDQSEGALAEASAKLDALKEEVTNAAVFLPGYDQRAYTTQLDQLTAQASALSDKLCPKARFSFSSRSRRTTESQGFAEKRPRLDGTSAEVVSEKPIISTPVQQIRDINKKFFTLPAIAALSTTLFMSHIQSSIVYIAPSEVSLSNVQLADCTGSLIVFASDIAGPIHLTRVSSSVIVFRHAHQFRMHQSEDTEVYMLTDGNPIVEACDDLSFGTAEFTDSLDTVTLSSFGGAVDDFDNPTGSVDMPLSWHAVEHSRALQVQDVLRNLTFSDPTIWTDQKVEDVLAICN